MQLFIDKNSFQKPKYVPESAWHKHSPFAFWLLAKLKPASIVELGVHNGFSFFLFCEYAQNRKGKSMCYAVDHWKGDEHAGFFDDSIYTKFLEHQLEYQHVSKILKTDFEKAVLAFTDNTIDLLHIDGRHYYDDVKIDFEMWRTKLKEDGIVLFHDVNVINNGFGVYKFWAELKKEFPLSFDFTHGYGLGILCCGNGATLPKIVYKLLTLSETKKEEIRNIYSVLGNQVHYEYLLKAYAVPFNDN